MTLEVNQTEERARDRFYVEKEKHPLFQTWGKDDDTSAFPTLKDVFVFAAALGFRNKRRLPLKGNRQHVGFWRVFTSQEDVPVLQALAIAETGDPSVVADQGQVIRIAEEYANGGIDLLVELERFERDATVNAIASKVIGESGAHSP